MTDHAHELRRYAYKVDRPAGDIPAVMNAAAAQIEHLERELRAAEIRLHDVATHCATVEAELAEIKRRTCVAVTCNHVARMERAEARVAELEAQVKAPEWQQIETAPADTIVLLAGEMDGPGDWRIKCGYRDDTTRSGWKIWGASWEPSLWMPLPQPPRGEG